MAKSTVAFERGYVGGKQRSWGQMIGRDWRRNYSAYLLMIPVMTFYIVWCYAPMYGIILAFKQHSPKLGILGSPWVGLGHFVEFFRSPYAPRVIRNTVLISIYGLLFQFPLPILLALLLNEVRGKFFKRTVQTVTYMPRFVSLIVVCGILVDFTATDGLFGVIQSMLGRTPVNFLGDARYFRSVYILSNIWQYIGWDSIIFLSALASVSAELYEAAVIDGAGRLKQTWHVTLPGIMPTISILLILRVGQMLNVGFEKVILLYGPMTYETGDVISSYVYRKGLVEMNFGFATAIGLFNSVINYVLVIAANRISAKLTETSLW